jgi:hypothetical protein
MVKTLSLRISDALADTGNVGGPTPECPVASRPGGSLAAVNSDGFRLASLPGERSKDNGKQHRVRAALPQQRGLRRGDCR